MRIFQTFVLPDALVAKYGLSFAGANFSRNLMSGRMFDKVYSLFPVNISGELPPLNEDGYEVVYSKWRKYGKLMAKLATFPEQVKIYRNIRKGDSIWFYNLNMINVLLYLLLTWFKPSVKRYVIILDFAPAKSWLEFNYWFLKLINHADGTISLSTSNLFTVKNSALLPGVVPEGIEAPEITKPQRKFLFSEALSEHIAMTESVLKAFSELPDCELHITGKNLDADNIVCEYAKRFPNIHYHRALPFDSYLELMHSVTFLLSSRNPAIPENQCNFPSKIIEALLHNRIIVSTLHYPQLKGINYLEVKANNLKEELKQVTNMSDATLLRYANQSAQVRHKFNTGVWQRTIEKIESLV